jgi:YVTN family beta-propeller protein
MSDGLTPQWPPLDQMSWREFERAMAAVFEGQGYHTTITPDGADGGVDLILERPGERVLVQCKHWKAWKVGVQTVRELVGVMTVRGASGGVVATTGRFTQEAVDFARTSGIRLIDGREVLALLRVTPPPFAMAVPAMSAPGVQRVIPRCPRCGEPMIVRVAGRGQDRGQQFWGCPRFPTCRGALPLAGPVAATQLAPTPSGQVPPTRPRSGISRRLVGALIVMVLLPVGIIGLLVSGITALAFAPARVATPTLIPQRPWVPSAMPTQPTPSLDPRVMASIALPVSPNKVAVDPGLNRLYVTAVETSSLVIIDTAKNSVVSTLTLQRQPGEIAVDTSSHTLWITNYNDASLTLLDADGKNPVVIPTGSGPAGVAVDASLHTAYVASALDKTIAAFDTATHKQTKKVTAYGQYGAAAVDTVSHTVCFSSEWLNIPYCYDSSLKSVGTLDVGGTSIAIDSVTHSHYSVNPKLTYMNVVDGTTGKRSSITVGTTPTGVTVDPNSHLVYITDHDRRALVIIKPS